MTQSTHLKSLDRPETTQDITTDPDLAGSLPEAALVALEASQIVKQLKGDYVVTNSELNQNFTTSNLSYEVERTMDEYLAEVHEDNLGAVGRAACEANRDYYQSLVTKAWKSYNEYQTARELWQNKLNKLTKPLDTDK